MNPFNSAPIVDPAFDLPAYLQRIGYRGRCTPTLDALAVLCAAHPAAIAFENIDPLLGRVPELTIGALQAKLVGQRRGGYCFEQNALLRQALLAFGCRVTSLAARVVWMAPAAAPPRPRTHMLLRVELPQATHETLIVDAGFGGHLLGMPLRLAPGVPQTTPTGRQRIVEDGALFTLETELPEGWSPQYRFTLDAQSPVDFEPLNWFVATGPTSMFRHNLLLERLTPTQRANLLNDRLTLRAPGAAPQVHVLTSAREFERVLDEVFDLQSPVPAATLFERVPKGLPGIYLP